jgi:hypothetical protein
MNGWIGIDLDGCLAEYHGWPKDNSIGAPIPKMVERVRKWFGEGKNIKIFTARVCVREGISKESGLEATSAFAESQRQLIKEWCRTHLGFVLEVTNVKDFGMIRLYDDRCIQVEANTGRLIGTEDEY